MSKLTSIVWLSVAIVMIMVISIISCTLIAMDDSPTNDNSIGVIISYSVGIIAALSVIVNQIIGLHNLVNSRMTELLISTNKASKKEGAEEEREKDEKTD